MSIENRDLKPGTKLVARYKGQEHTAEVVETEAGVRYRLADGRDFKSPSSAGSAVMGGNACNGWRFWSLADEEPGKRPKKAAAKEPPGKRVKKNGLFERMEDGRYFCSACQEPFEAPKDIEPKGCPKGHRPEGFKQA